MRGTIKRTVSATMFAATAMWVGSSAGQAAKPPATCDGLPDQPKLKQTLQTIIKQGKAVNTGLGNHEWAAVVNRDGVVCAVAFSGPDRGAQWPGSRLIAAEKANTANALSGPEFALSTANLYAGSQPGQSLYSLATAAPPNPQAVFAGSPADFGQPNDPLVGKPIGGIIVFGGGLPLYDAQGKLVGGLGVSGDTSCADHVIAWKVRNMLKLDAVPAGVAPNGTDNMIMDIQNGVSVSGYGHPSCKGGKPSDDVIRELPTRFPSGKKK
jgi:uncharacterized protein GlcG (DUF336 family)